MEKSDFESILPNMEGWQEPGDYCTPEGILMCGKCHTPKMAFVTVPGLFDNRPSPRPCKCLQEYREREEAERNRQIALERIDRLRKQGLTAAQYIDSTFALDDRADEKASNICTRYVAKWDEIKAKNIGLLLHGDVGGGKTFLASCIANALLDKGEAVIMTTIPALSMAMNANFGSERASILEHVRNVPLLILDDVGMSRNTAAALESAYDIVNTRYKEKKPLVITTNLTMTAIRDEKETNLRRIYDRIIEMCSPVKVAGIERRKNIARNKMQEMTRLLDGE